MLRALTSKIVLFPLLLAVLLPTACDLYLSDRHFREGKGNVTGTVEIDGAPARGAQVYLSILPLALPTGPDGSFLLDDLPVGEHEIIIRAATENKAVRTRVVVVADSTSDLGTLTLNTASELKVLVKDPDLQIEGATVRLKEVPGLVGLTDASGIACFPSLPPASIYTALVTRFPFVFVPTSGPQPGSWEKGFTVEPDPGIPQNRAQIYYAYERLMKFQRQLTPCAGECHIPAQWDWPGPPCPWPIGEITEENRVLEDELIYFAAQIAVLDRIRGRGLDWLSCPSLSVLTAHCAEGACQPSATFQVPVAAGYASKGCIDGTVIDASTPEELDGLRACLGLGPLADPEPGSYYVFIKLPSGDEPPRLEMAYWQEDRYHLHFSTGFYASQELSPVPPEDLPWALYLLDVEDPDKIEAHLSWIDPIP